MIVNYRLYIVGFMASGILYEYIFVLFSYKCQIIYENFTYNIQQTEENTRKLLVSEIILKTNSEETVD